MAGTSRASAAPSAVGSHALGPGRVDRPPLTAAPDWEHTYARLLLVLDAVLVTAASALALLLRFGDADAQLTATRPGSLTGPSYTVIVAAITPVWIGVLAASRAYESRFLGTGSEEFKRVVNGTVRFVALLAFLAYAARAEVSRGFVGVALPLGGVLLLLGRFAARKALHRARRQGRCLHRVVAVGSVREVEELIASVGREPYAGLTVVAVALPGLQEAPALAGSPAVLLGPTRELAGRLRELDADTVAVAGTSLTSRELRELAWDLEGTGVDLVVAPSITDVTGPRIHVRPVAGLPLLHLEEPTFGGVRRGVKRFLDLSASLLLLLALALPFAVVAVLVRRDSEGPVFYRQERVGKDGQLFRIWKFRTMRTGADLELASLAALNEHDGPLFKMKNDPRITKVGATLRQYSIDELPQLFNVLTGSMSLVGPRPPLADEVAKYATHVHRRLLVKPGMTGLWQVSGRADLDWEEAVRLDLYYVENWSVALDGMILWKTVFEVVKGSGAY